MYSYQNAANAVAGLQELDVERGVTPEQAIDLAASLADTIGQWESNDDIAAKTMQGMSENITELNRQLDETVEENQALADANATFATEAITISQLREALSASDARNLELMNEVGGLRQEVDGLIDEKIMIASELDKSYATVQAIKSVLVATQ